MDNGLDYLNLCRALAWLSPNVFFHPLWIGYDLNPSAHHTDLSGELKLPAERLLASGDIDSACQVYFVCAALQKCGRNYPQGLEFTQQAWQLGKRHDLEQICAWAAWGASSLQAHLGDTHRAEQQLEWLLEALRKGGDWSLANLVWLARQHLLESPARSPDPGIAVDWLYRWGESPVHIASSYLPAGDFSPSGTTGYYATAAAPSPSSWWQALWQTIGGVARGELRLKWVRRAHPSPVGGPRPVDRRRQDQPVAVFHPERFLYPPRPAQRRGAVRAAGSGPPFTAAHSRWAPLDEPHLTGGSNRTPAAQANGAMSGLNTPVAHSAYPTGDPPSQNNLTAYLLGPFQIFIDDQAVVDWPSLRGCSILKYLLVHRSQPVPRDVLMEVFWPEHDPEAARNSLNVAIYGLRQALRAITDEQIVVYNENAYGLQSDLPVWVDCEEFELKLNTARRHEGDGQLATAIREYEIAASLYVDDFMPDEPYEDWAVRQRERLRVAYLEALDHLSGIYFEQGQYAACTNLCRRILERDNCREDAHRRLMRCYSRQDQHYLALRQFNACVAALRFELDVPPSQATVELFEQIRRRAPV